LLQDKPSFNYPDEFLLRNFFGAFAGCYRIPADFKFSVALHLGTLLGVIIYFRRDFSMMFTALVKPHVLGDEARTQRLFVLYICLGTIPAVVAGYLLQDAWQAIY
jgi:undecaprenyl pyrophosphate phosphatase UppP